MRWIFYNIVALAFIALTAYMLYLGKDNWGWPLFLAFLSGVAPKSVTTTKNG